VFAIAATLLVLEISVPAGAFEHLWRAIGDLWPSYLAYLTSFLTISGLWLAHHALFVQLRHADASLIRMNLVLLVLVAFLPFPTSLVGEAIGRASAERSAVLFYGGTLFVVSAVITSVCRYVAAHDELLAPGGREVVDFVTARTTPRLAFYGLVLVLAFVAPDVAAFGFLTIALTSVLYLPRGPAAEPRSHADR
jgi:uncharacterized membrane protein